MENRDHTQKNQRLRTFLRYVKGDEVSAGRAMLGVPAYDAYLQHQRHH